MHPVVRSVGADERLAEVLHRGLAGVLDLLLEQHHTVRPSSLLPIDRTDATTLGPHADLRLLIHLDLGDHEAGRRIPPSELDAGGLANQTASSVAPDEVLASDGGVVGQLDLDAGFILGEPRRLASTKDRDPELIDPAGQDGLDPVLPEREDVVVARGEVAYVQEGPGVAHERMRLALREEALRDASLIEHLDRARVKTPGSLAVEILTCASFDDDSVDPRQGQLGRQHEPGRAATCDYDRMFCHCDTSSAAATGSLRRPVEAPSLSHTLADPVSNQSGVSRSVNPRQHPGSRSKL